MEENTGCLGTLVSRYNRINNIIYQTILFTKLLIVTNSYH